MAKKLIMLSSITYAIKARDLLSRHGIRAEIQRTPKNSKNSSCGYGIHVGDDSQKAIEILNKNSIKVLGTVDRMIL